MCFLDLECFVLPLYGRLCELWTFVRLCVCLKMAMKKMMVRWNEKKKMWPAQFSFGCRVLFQSGSFQKLPSTKLKINK